MKRAADLAAPPALPSIAEALRESTARLMAAGLPEPRREARQLLARVLDAGIEQVVGYPERRLTAGQVERLGAFLSRRAAREPLSRILGAREFWGLNFQLSPASLDPRPDSETLVEAVLDSLQDRAAPLSLLDLGTGTGCLLLALLSELPASSGLGVDTSTAALETSAANAMALGLAERARFCAGDWGTMLSGRFNLVVSNPPYIEEAAIDGLEPEVFRHDPRKALVAGADGLDAYRRILPALPDLLAPGGFAVLEIGLGQGHSVAELARDAGLSQRASRCDLAGIERCVLLETGA